MTTSVSQNTRELLGYVSQSFLFFALTRNMFHVRLTESNPYKLGLRHGCVPYLWLFTLSEPCCSVPLGIKCRAYRSTSREIRTHDFTSPGCRGGTCTCFTRVPADSNTSILVTSPILTRHSEYLTCGCSPCVCARRPPWSQAQSSPGRVHFGFDSCPFGTVEADWDGPGGSTRETKMCQNAFSVAMKPSTREERERGTFFEVWCWLSLQRPTFCLCPCPEPTWVFSGRTARTSSATATPKIIQHRPTRGEATRHLRIRTVGGVGFRAWSMECASHCVHV